MSNSKLVTYTKITKNKTSPRKGKIDAIIIHCIVGQWTAKQGCDYFASTDRECSANYVVGKDGSIGLSVDEKDRAWTSGGSLKVNGISGADWDHRAVTIEVASDTKHPYAVTDKALEALIALCTDICKRNSIKQLLWQGDKSLVGKISKQNMAVHRWFANKACPGDYLYNLHPQIAAEVNKRLGVVSQPTQDENAALEYAVGDVVTFKGTKHYASSNGTNGKNCKPGEARVTSVAKKGKHPYHLIKTTGSSSTVYGWVDAADVSTEETAVIVKGSTVKVKKGAKTYTGGSLASFVYSGTYTVMQVSGARVVIGKNGVVTAAINIKALALVG